MHNRSIVIVIILSLGLGASILTRGHEWGDDFASYIMQAESVLTGTTLEFVDHNSFTILESSSQIGPIAYPWGYPLILTPVLAAKGIHPLALKLPALFFYAGFLACLYLLMKLRLPQIDSVLLVCLFAFNPLLLKFLDQILSDIPFLFFSTLALYLVSRTDRHTNSQLILIGTIIFIAYFIRTTGVLLLASFIAANFFEAIYIRADRESWRRYLREMIIVCVTFGILFFLNLLLFPEGESSHLARYQEFNISTAFQFTGAYFSLFSFFFGETIIWKIIYYFLFIFFLIGAWVRRKEENLFISFFVLWMILLITWPAWQGPRFIFPLLPFFIYFTFQGMKYVLGKLPEKYGKIGQWLMYGFWSLIAIIFLFHSSVNAYANLKNGRTINGPFDSYSQEVYKYIAQETPADSVVVFFKPRVMRMMTDRDSIMSTECDRILKGNYLVLSKKVGENQQIPPEEINNCNLPLKQVLTNNRFVVYEIQK